jgi:hypothetical protein
MPFQNTQTPPDIVFYPSPGLNGFTAAWAIYQAFPDAGFVPLNYGDKFELIRGYVTPLVGEGPRYAALFVALKADELVEVTGKHVIFVDVSVSCDKLLELAQFASEVTILNHQATVEDSLKDLPGSCRIVQGSFHDAATGEMFVSNKTCSLPVPPRKSAKIVVIIDKEKSGARLAWEWAHGYDAAPSIVTHVEDRDLWRFALPNTAEVVRFLSTYEMSFEAWGQASLTIESGRAAEIGRYLEAALRIEVNRLVKTAVLVPSEVIEVSFREDVGGSPLNAHYGKSIAVAFTQKIDVCELGHALLDAHKDTAFAMLVCIEKGEAHVSTCV